MLTECHIFVRYARMRRIALPASACPPRARCAGLLLALPAILGQLLIATPHETVRAIADRHAASVLAFGNVLAAPTDNSAQPHDPAGCPTCQAAAQGRAALVIASIARSLFLLPGLESVSPDTADLPSAQARSAAAPRAPPV